MKGSGAILAVLLAGGLLSSAWAGNPEPTAGCHCFRDRTYDPANRFAADPYLQTTVMNGLLAGRYHIGKREIVMARMQDGAPADDLLLALHLGEQMTAGWRTLLHERRHGIPWLELARRLPAAAADDGPAAPAVLAAQLRTGLPAAVVARLVVDDLLRRQFPAEASRLPGHRARGLHERELAVLLLLHREGGPPVAELIDRYQRQGQSLAQLADQQGVSPAALGHRAAGE